jgi:predicted ester cyclase
MAVRDVTLAALFLSACACSIGPSHATERNEALIRQFIQDVDRLPGSEVIDKWMTSDFTLRANGGAPMDLEAYKAVVAQMNKGFSHMTHELHDVVVNGDSAAVTVTLRATHTGEYQGLAPTGKSIAIEEAIFWQLRDGKIASQVVIADTAGVQRQLTAK